MRRWQLWSTALMAVAAALAVVWPSVPHPHGASAAVLLAEDGAAGRPVATATPSPTPGAAAGPSAAGVPALAGPDDGATVSDMNPLLRWSNPPGTVQYHLQVLPAANSFSGAPDGPGIDLIIGDPAQVRRAQYQVLPPRAGVGDYTLLPDMTYTWRVRTTTAATSIGSEDARWGPWASRTFRTPVLDSSTLTLLPPQDAVAGRTPTLRWTNSDPRVFYYEVQVSQDSTFTTDPKAATAMVYWELRHGGVTTPLNSYTIPKDFPLESGKVYWWRVRPRVQGDARPVNWPNPVGLVGGAETTAPACFLSPTTDANGDVHLPAYAATFDSAGRVIMPAPATVDSSGTALPPGFNGGPNEVVDHWTDANQGPLTTLYPNFNPSSPDLYQYLNSPENPCGPTSIGGETPDESPLTDVEGVVNEEEVNDELTTALNELITPDSEYLKIDPLPAVNVGNWLPDLNGPCEPTRLEPCGLTPGALQGRDIIFVNGLLMDATELALQGVAQPEWPADPASVLSPSGHWKELANRYWDDHIKHFLTNRGRKNRYITIAYPMTQRLAVGRHAMLTQIAMAMATGHAVINPDPNDPRGTGGFCAAGCVIVSHSTGALLTGATMATAADPALAAQFASVQYIPRFMKLHVALGGAISGSQIAGAMVAIAAGTQGSGLNLCILANLNLGRPLTSGCANWGVLTQSVLVDLTPPVNQALWAPVMGQPPANHLPGRESMPTLTVASGHHANYIGLKRWLELGLGDGVVTMDSSCGKATHGGWPTGFRPKHPVLSTASSISPLVFDLGMRAVDAVPAWERARLYFREQTYEHLLNQNTFVPARVAGACTPYLAPWGMVEPVHSIITSPASPHTYYPNHYPLIQTTETHGAGLKEGKEWGNEDVLATSAASRDVTNRPGGMGLVNQAIEGQMHEFVKGPHRTFWLPINISVSVNPSCAGTAPKYCVHVAGLRITFNKQFHTVWLWKRTYHRFQNVEQNEAAEYVYNYVLPGP